ncbi:hypothetical protein, partial [Pseudomonas sp. GM80]|uniref:hypothetical protein n=1 Tax=Pseudomonas sp. GM80 TaxID=1144339 RepID=UPI001EE67C23
EGCDLLMLILKTGSKDRSLVALVSSYSVPVHSPASTGLFYVCRMDRKSVQSGADTALYGRLKWQLSQYTSKLFRYCFTQE